VPLATKSQRSKSDLFNHLVGAQQDSRRQVKTKGFGSLAVDDGLKFARSLDRKVRGF
jgi:hypothetical protein